MRRFSFVAGFFFFLLFVFFSFLVQKDLFTQLDFNTTVRLQDHLPRRLDTFFSFFSVLGSFEITFLMLLGVMWLSKKKKAFLLLFSFGGILFIELLGKIFLTHPGPPFMFARYQHFFEFPSNFVPHPESAYPSGHSSRTIFLSVLCFFMIVGNKNISAYLKAFFLFLLFVYDFLMLLTRVALGEHWFSDVIGGVFLGLAIGFWSRKFIY